MRQCRSKRSDVSGATSSRRSTSSPWGTSTASAMWDSSHSFCSRTSISFAPLAISSRAAVQIEHLGRHRCLKSPNPYPESQVYFRKCSNGARGGATNADARTSSLRCGMFSVGVRRPSSPDAWRSDLGGRQLRRRVSGEHRLDRGAVALGRPSEQPSWRPGAGAGSSAGRASRATPAAARRRGAPRRASSASRSGASPRASRRPGSTSPARGGRCGRPRGRTTTSPRPPPRAGRGRRPRRTCATPGRTGPRRASTSVGPATQDPVSQLTSSRRSSRYGSVRARTAAGCSAAGTRALTQGQAPTSGPLADGCTVRSGLSTRGPTRPPSSAAAAASRSRPSSSSSVSGLSSTVTGLAAVATPAFEAAPKPTFSGKPMNRCGALPAGRGDLGRVGRRVVDDDQLLAAVEESVHRRHQGAQVLRALPGDDDDRVLDAFRVARRSWGASGAAGGPAPRSAGGSRTGRRCPPPENGLTM